MKKEMIFPLFFMLIFSGICCFTMFYGLKEVPFFKFIGQAVAAIFNFAISAFAHG